MVGKEHGASLGKVDAYQKGKFDTHRVLIVTQQLCWPLWAKWCAIQAFNSLSSASGLIDF